MKLRTLYYPYARSFNRAFLKQSILIFDEIWFSDPMERAIRETIGLYNSVGKTVNNPWNSIKEDYDFLIEKGLFRIFDPCPIVRDYDGLLAQAMLCDKEDEEFTSLASQLASKDYWGIYRRRVASNELLDAANEFWGSGRWPHPTSIKSPEPKDEFEKRYYKTYSDFSSPYIMAVEHFYIPPNLGYSVNINNALLISQVKGLTLLTDDIAALHLLNLKYSRAKTQLQDTVRPSSILARKRPEYLQKYNLLAINVIDALLPSEELDKRSFKELIEFKEANTSSLERFHLYLSELTAQISSEPWSPSLELDIIKLVDTKVIPEATKVRDGLRSAYEKMFGSIIKKATATLSPTLVASFLTGLTSGQILTLSCAAVAGALSIALPEIIDLWQEEKKVHRNGVSFLLALKES